MLGLLCRNLSHTHEEVHTAAYQTPVRSRLEYCSSIWSPPQLQIKSQIEGVKRRAARFVLNKSYCRSVRNSVSDMLRHLKWDSLERRCGILSCTRWFMDIWQFQLPIIQPLGVQLVDSLHHIVSSPTTHIWMHTNTPYYTGQSYRGTTYQWKCHLPPA